MQLKTIHQRKRKYFLLILLLIAIGLTKGYAYDFSAVCSTGQTLYYNIIDADNHYVEITHPGELHEYFGGWWEYTEPSGDIVIPDSVQYNGAIYIMTSIGEYAFYLCYDYGSATLTIPNSVSTIGNYSFYNCSGFTGILTIPNSVTSIGKFAFSGCSGFSEVVFNASNCADADYYYPPFQGCIGTLTIGDNVERIPASIFKNCSGFTGGLTIPNSVTSIGASSFYGCNGFTGNLTIPNSVTSIGASSFYGCSGFTGNLNIPNSVITISREAFRNCSGFTGSLIIPSSVISIGEIAFFYCSGFSEVIYNATNCADINTSYSSPFDGVVGTLTIGENVERIPARMFYNCGSFSGSLTIPSSVTAIGNYAFYSCIGFTDSLTIPNSVTSIGSGAFNNCSGFTEVYYNAVNDLDYNNSNAPFSGCSGTLIIGNNVERIPACLFYGSSFTGDLAIPNSITSIGNNSFYNCSGFTGILTIPNSMTSIGKSAFHNCTGFSKVVFNASNCADADYSSPPFQGCIGTLTIGENVQRIPSYMFRYGGFTAVNFNAINCANVNNSPFSGYSGVHTITIGDNVSRIPNNLFRYCSGFTSNLTIPNSVTSIGSNAFYNCNGLTGCLTIPSTVASIGISAFDGCSGFTEVVYNAINCEDLNGLSSPFQNCGSTLIIGEDVERIPSSMFYNCNNFTGDLTIPNSVVSIGYSAFYGCSGFTELVFNATNCTNTSSSSSSPFSGFIGTLTIGDNVERIPASIFRNCSGFTGDLTIPNSVVSIGNYAFYNCSGFMGCLSIGESVTSIGNYAFSGCSGFTSINSFAEVPPSAVASTFYNVDYSIPVAVPLGSEIAYQYAEGWNQFYYISGAYRISAYSNPENGGLVTGGGLFLEGEICTLTANTNTGYYFVNWTKDGDEVSTESTLSFSVTENATYIANFIAIPRPDLHVTGIANTALFSGQQATISWTVKNDGAGPTPNGAIWHDRVWLSVESRVAADDNNPILLGTFDNLSALAPGEYYTQTQSFTIPMELSGNYYLFVLTDAYDCHTIYWGPDGVPLPYSPPPYIGCLSHHCNSCPNVADNLIYELSEFEHGDAPGSYYNDNFFYKLVDIAIPNLPDLQVTSVVAPEEIIGIFNPYTESRITATIRNMGVNDITNGHWKDKLYMSLGSEGNSAILVGVHAHSGPLGVGESYQVNEWTSGWEIMGYSGRGEISSVFVGYMLSGDIRFFVQTDGYDDVYERLENNNIGVSNVMHAYLGATGDLEPSDLNVSDTVSTGEVFSYSYRVYNNGAGEPFGIGDPSTLNRDGGIIYYYQDNWWDKIYLCQNADTLDASAILLKKIHHFGGLDHGTYYSVSESMVLPPGITSGNYYLYVLTDTDNVVYEYNNEDNNLARSHVITVVRPDLQVTQVLTPEQITTGYPLNISYTLANAGEGSIINCEVTDRIYISASGNMTDTVRLASIRHNVYLPSGQSLTMLCNDLAPSNLSGGIYHLIVVTDCGHEINESNEVNNTGSLYPISVAYPPMPDLEPVSLTLPEVIQAGANISVQFDVTNNGDLDLLNSNCTFDIYAVWNDHEILCPVQSQTLPLGNYVSIGINETLHFVRTIMVPPTVTSACSTFELIVNKGGLVPELDTTNNIFTTTATVLDCPLPDLAIVNISANAIQSGVENQISFTVNNVGTADFEGSFNTVAYVRSATDTILCPLVLQISPEANSYNIPMGGTLSFTQKLFVPPMAHAGDLLEVIVDEENLVLETNEDNNATTSVAEVINYPFDLNTTTLQVPETVWAGEALSLTWTVMNIGTCPSEAIPLYVKRNGTYTLVQGDILPQPWMDKVFVSNDAVLSEDDIEVCSVARSTVLQPNGTYSVEQSVTIPYTNLGAQYLLCVSDATHVTYDSDTLNNVKSIPIEVQLGVLPDLRITSLTVQETVTCDRAYWLYYTVINEGERVTQKENWTDEFYIGEAMTTIGALQLGSKIHHGALAVGESYTDSIEIVIPSGLEGDYYLMGFTDKTDQIYEHDNEDDNLLALPVKVLALDPSDLVAMQIEFPVSVESGGDMTVSWRLRNNGPFPAVGRIRNAVYLSADATWSSDDRMFGYADLDVNIAVNGQQSCQLSGPITGLDEGRYYVIVKANILNALNETSYENNVSVSLIPTEITFPILAIGETIRRTIEPKRYNYYKIAVGPEYEGQAMMCRMVSLNHDLSVANEIYLSHESVPTPMDFDYGDFMPYSYVQEIIIPALQQGTYYLMAQGAAFHEVDPIIIGVSTTTRYIDTISAQSVIISTSIVNFEILSVQNNHGSNAGSVTTKVTGAKFDSIMDFRLVKGGDYLPAEKVFFSNGTEAYVTFDFKDMPFGNYSMEAELPGGIITIKDRAFTIEKGLPAELDINIINPASVRKGNAFPVTIEYANVGTSDLDVIGLMVVSRNGHPIGFTSEELLDGQTAIGFYTAEENGNPNVMRPGYHGSKCILVKASSTMDVDLAVYAFRR